MSQIPSDHLVFLKQRPFVFGCSKEVFPETELKLLSEYGHWMSALAQGLILPITPAQEHFLQVDRKGAKPETVHERAWFRLKGRGEFEREHRFLPPHSVEDYGIVEWDADRWW